MFTIKILHLNIFLLLLGSSESEWKLSLDKDNIIIFTRDVESSNFNEFLAEAKMTGTIEDFKRIITDIENYAAWVPDCKSTKIVESPNLNNITYHIKLKVPFPFANRDMVQQITLKESKDVLEVLIQNHPNKVKKEKKYVRIQKAYGKWTIKAFSENEISIKFQYLADPGGEIPAWLVNSFIVKSPHKSLKNIRELMAE